MNSPVRLFLKLTPLIPHVGLDTVGESAGGIILQLPSCDCPCKASLGYSSQCGRDLQSSIPSDKAGLQLPAPSRRLFTVLSKYRLLAGINHHLFMAFSGF